MYSAIGLRAQTSQRVAILIAAPVTFIANRLWGFRSIGDDHSPDHEDGASAPATSAKNTSYSRM